jgi:hypothetical protein
MKSTLAAVIISTRQNSACSSKIIGQDHCRGLPWLKDFTDGAEPNSALPFEPTRHSVLPLDPRLSEFDMRDKPIRQLFGIFQRTIKHPTAGARGWRETTRITVVQPRPCERAYGSVVDVSWGSAP